MKKFWRDEVASGRVGLPPKGRETEGFPPMRMLGGIDLREDGPREGVKAGFIPGVQSIMNYKVKDLGIRNVVHDSLAVRGDREHVPHHVRQVVSVNDEALTDL